MTHVLGMMPGSTFEPLKAPKNSSTNLGAPAVLAVIAGSKKGFVLARETGNETWVPCRACRSVQDYTCRALVF